MYFARPCGIEDSDMCYLRNANLSCLVWDLKLSRVARRPHFALPFREETPFSQLHRYRAQMIHDKLCDDGTGWAMQLQLAAVSWTPPPHENFVAGRSRLRIT
jgi:hypothetical protein